MKRRHLCQYLALGAASAATVLPSPAALPSGLFHPSAKTRHRWVLLYWMPYDNDKSEFGEPIVDMLARGSTGLNTIIAVQSDYWGPGTMRRRVVADGAVTEIYDLTLEEDSSDVSNFANYLNWARQRFEAEHWAIIILGHGGKINEVSPDDHSTTTQRSSWMRVDQLAQVVRQFNQATNSRVELLFFQNCNKATLEVIYEVRECARYTMASQLLIGAPSLYYEGFLARLDTPLENGWDAAIAIMDSEVDYMYHSLTLVDNLAIADVPKHLNTLFQTLQEAELPRTNLLELTVYGYADEYQCDLLGLLRHFTPQDTESQAAMTNFSEFIRQSVICEHRTEGSFYKYYQPGFVRRNGLTNLCGIGLYLPESEDAISRYQSLALSQSVDLTRFYQAILRTITIPITRAADG